MQSQQATPCFNWIDASAAPRAALICVHGLGLHAGTYRSFGERMCRSGIATYAIDVRGFGSWSGSNDCRLDFDACVLDLSEKIKELKDRQPGLPVFLLGESLGGAIATRFIADNPGLVKGLITSAPVRRLSDHKGEFFRALWQFLLHPLQPISLSPHLIEQAPHMVAVNADRTFRMQFTASELIHLCHFLEKSFKRATKVKDTPVLVVQGHSDDVVDSRSTLAFFDRLRCKDKSLVVFGHVNHLIFQSHDVHTKALQLVQEWIFERSPETQLQRRQAG